MSEADRLAEALEKVAACLRDHVALPGGIVERARNIALEALAAYQASQSEGAAVDVWTIARIIDPETCESIVPAKKVGERIIRNRRLPIMVLKEPEASEQLNRYAEAHRKAVKIADLLSAAPPPPSAPEWRGMESAPRDGTPVLVYRGASDKPVVSVGLWESGSWLFFIENGSCQYGRSPTHWLPLPAPPKETR